MILFEDGSFFVLLVAALIPAFLLGYFKKSQKVYMLALSALFIVEAMRTDWKQLVYLVIYLFLMIHAIRVYLLLREKYGRNKVIYYHFLLLALAPLLICKLTGLVNLSIFGFIGISYITFKVIQIIIEIYDGVIKEVKLFDLLNFLLFFPTFSSGPIDRSRRFDSDISTVPDRSAYLELAGQGLKNLMIGAVYKFVLASVSYHYLTTVFSQSCRPLYLIGYAYCYGIYMFFDFAGYSKMAVGVSNLLAVRTPDNFRYPFISVDMTDFWNRWHITLSQWFRDFIFSRFMMASIHNKWFKKRLSGAAVGLIVNMLIMGLWHGLTSYYVAYGLYHGVLLALTEIYHKKSGFYKRNKDKKLYKVCSWFVTLNMVMFGFLIFSGRANTAVLALLKRIL